MFHKLWRIMNLSGNLARQNQCFTKFKLKWKALLHMTSRGQPELTGCPQCDSLKLIHKVLSHKAILILF